jgi:hypothetical protein
MCKDDLMTRLIGDSCKQSVIKSFHRAYRNLAKKKSIIEEPRTMLTRYKIAIVTWVNRTPKSENTILGNN